MVNVNNN